MEKEFFEDLEGYWKEREKRWKRIDLFYIGMTVGAIIAAIGFLMEIYGIAKEGGMILGVSGVLVTLICAFWGARETIREIRKEMRDSTMLIIGEITKAVKEEGKRVEGVIRGRERE